MCPRPPFEIVRASGCCAACDHRFVNELVARYPSGSAANGFAYVELRHLELAVEATGEDTLVSYRAASDAPSAIAVARRTVSHQIHGHVWT